MMDLIELIYSAEIRRYFFVGIMTTIIGYLAFFLLCTGLDPKVPIELQIANTISWIVGVTFSFITSKKYVFKDDGKNLLPKVLKFFSLRVAVMIIEGFQLYLYVTILKYDYKIMKICASVVTVIFNYCLSKYFVFNKGKNADNKLQI